MGVRIIFYSWSVCGFPIIRSSFPLKGFKCSYCDDFIPCTSFCILHMTFLVQKHVMTCVLSLQSILLPLCSLVTLVCRAILREVLLSVQLWPASVIIDDPAPFAGFPRRKLELHWCRSFVRLVSYIVVVVLEPRLLRILWSVLDVSLVVRRSFFLLA